MVAIIIPLPDGSAMGKEDADQFPDIGNLSPEYRSEEDPFGSLLQWNSFNRIKKQGGIQRWQTMKTEMMNRKKPRFAPAILQATVPIPRIVDAEQAGMADLKRMKNAWSAAGEPGNLKRLPH